MKLTGYTEKWDSGGEIQLNPQEMLLFLGSRQFEGCPGDGPVYENASLICGGAVR